MGKKLGLDDAYSVQTPEDNRALYRDWAESYERDFTEAHGYVYHEEVVRLFVSQRQEREIVATTPILDVGCGTGVVGVALERQGFSVIDGIDLSPEMLLEAEKKAVYRTLTEVDVTEPLPLADASYGGVVSSGTFTHGHLGPAPLRELARVGQPGALFAIGINAEHFAEHGFAEFLDQLADDGRIDIIAIEEIPIYDGRTSQIDDGHDGDVANVALYTTT